jgi:hypothetical protein
MNFNPQRANNDFSYSIMIYLHLRSIIIIIYLFTAIRLLPGGSGYFTCKQNLKSVTTKFKSGELHEKHVVATWNVANRLSICL